MKDQTFLSFLSAYDLVPPVEPFSLPHQGKNNILSGLHTGAGDLVWKNYISSSYSEVASILYEHQLLKGLAAAGLSFAVPVPLPTRDGSSLMAEALLRQAQDAASARMQAPQRGGTEGLAQGPYGWAALEPRLPGLPLDPTRLDQVEALGSALGELQTALRGNTFGPHASESYPLRPRPGRPLFGQLFQFPQPECEPFSLTPTQLGLPANAAYEALLDWWREEALQLQAFVEGPYRALPWQMCHNDFTPANLLVQGNQISAVLDFEFAAPAARALDVVMGLRMTMRYWENPEPWSVVQRFCRGYSRWLTLTEAEILALPWLLRLRSAIPTLWWLGRTDLRRDPGRVPVSIGFQQEVGRWLERYGSQWVEVVREAILRK